MHAVELQVTQFASKVVQATHVLFAKSVNVPTGHTIHAFVVLFTIQLARQVTENAKLMQDTASY